jgi:starch synthase
VKVAFVSSEVYPFSKTGGLGDVSESLPVALKEKGLDIIIITPFYSIINRKNFQIEDTGVFIKIYLDYKWINVKIFKYFHKNIPVYFLYNEEYFSVEKIYNGTNIDIRFGLLCYSAIEICKKLNFKPDIFHINDWQTSLIPVILKTNYINDNFFHNTKTLLTIHNLAYQGYFPKESLKRLGLPDHIFNINGIEFYGQVNFLKGGILFSDFINTVSPTYAKEILTFEAGRGLHGVLREKKSVLCGIINGIDYDEWNPGTDKYIFQNYNIDSIEDKTKNKVKLQRKLNLKVNEKIPLFAFVGRLIEQKGVSLLTEILPNFEYLNCEIVILGTGDEYFQKELFKIAEKHFDKISVNFVFSEEFSREIYAGADFFLMPSLYEPCGISQLISMRYGTIPIVREVGGLKDTVDNETGFIFKNFSKTEFFDKILKALELYSINKNTFKNMQLTCMRRNFSWENSASEYFKIYKELTGF